MWGLVQVARVTFVIDRQGIIRWEYNQPQVPVINPGSIVRDALEGTMNYGAHAKFVEKWLETLKSET